MHSGALLTTLQAREAGPVAWRALRLQQSGAVHSVFSRSAYFELGEALVCIGPRGLGNGPLNLLCEPWPDGPALAARIAPGDAIAADGWSIRVGAFAISLAGLSAWRPPPAAMAWEADALRRGLGIATAVTCDHLPADGLAPLLRPDPREIGSLPPVARAAHAPAQYLASLVEAATSGRTPRIDADRIASLLGLGPGLTPSGDDYLGGALVALARLDLTSLRDAIWGAIRPRAPALTNAVSYAHLAAAAEGFGSAALHALIDAMLAADAPAISAGVRAVAAIGHTSGWDAYAGAAAVLRARALATEHAWAVTGAPA